MGIVCIRALSVLHCKTLWHHHHFYVCVYKNNSMDHNQVWARVYRNSKPALTYAWKLCDSQRSNKHYRNMCDSHYCITIFFLPDMCEIYQNWNFGVFVLKISQIIYSVGIVVSMKKYALHDFCHILHFFYNQ